MKAGSFRIVQAVDKDNLAPHRALQVRGVRFTLGHQIGVGRFSTVFVAQDEWGGAFAAKLYHGDAPQVMWKNEVQKLHRFRHSNIVELLAGFEVEGGRYVITRHAGVSLGRLALRSELQVRERFARRVARDLLQAVHALHSHGHVHGDINPQNCLVRSRGDQMELRLADFSFCRPFGDVTQGLMRTAKWMPLPELLEKRPAHTGTGTDTYLAALVLLQCALGEPLESSDDHTMSGELKKQCETHDSAFVRALAPALDFDPLQRPDTLTLWRKLTLASSSATGTLQ